MPPKRKSAGSAAASKASNNATTAVKTRRSKLAKEHNISNEEEAEIRAAFDLFTQESNTNEKREEPYIATADVRRCLIALDTPPTDNNELRELLEIADADDSGRVSFEHFIAVAALKLHHSRAERDDDALAEEVAQAFHLFTKGQDRDITIQDLRRVAKELKEDVPENVLKDMLREATGGTLGPVGMEDFESVMKRAGVFN